MNKSKFLLDKLYKDRTLTFPEYEYLISNQNTETAHYARELADEVRREYYSNEVFVSSPSLKNGVLLLITA